MRSLFFLILVLFSQTAIFCQETTGSLSGYITNTEGEEVPFATIQLVQKSTDRKFSTISGSDGYFAFNQLAPDTSYSIKVSAVGHLDYVYRSIPVLLGQKKEFDINLYSSPFELKEARIIYSSNDPLKNPRKGNEQTISSSNLRKVPTSNRSIQDITRILPEANLNSFGGANYRFNNLSIDGAATNDVIGFQEPTSGAAGSSASGTPGGLAQSQPIGFGAVKEISVKSAPFNVRYGNFTGANINAISNSGTNKFEGSIYGFNKNPILYGNYLDGFKQTRSQFTDVQSGIGIGGPILKSRLFFFINYEFTYRNEPIQNKPGSETSNIPLEIVNEIRQSLIDNYDYDAGFPESPSRTIQSNKYFARLDFFINENHKLTLRNNFVSSFADNLDWSSNFFRFSNQGYRHHSKTNSIVAELKSTFGQKISNQFMISQNTVRDNRDFSGRVFPHIEINYNSVGTIFAGSYREASIYGLDLGTTQISDHLTFYHDKHTISGGFNLELNDIKYKFLTAWNGRWAYSSVNNFLNDMPSRVRGVYNISNNDYSYNQETPSADFSMILGSVYLQDEYRLNKKVNIYGGIRIDAQISPESFPVNNSLSEFAQFASLQNNLNTKPILNPRFGFNAFLDDKKDIQLRGGTGTFSGRMPFVWYAYAHYNSGTDYSNIDIKPSIALALTEDLSELSSIQSGLTEINLIDENFNLPRDWKSNIAIDWRLPKDFIFSLEGTYSKVLSGLYFRSINRIDSVGNLSGADNRPYFLATGDDIKVNPNFTNVFMIANTNQGYRYNVTASLLRSNDNSSSYIGYTYGMSKDLNSTVRNSHAANFEWNQAVDSRNPELSYSNFDLRHKFIGYYFQNFDLGRGKLNVGAIYTVRSGSPYSFVYQGDLNKDGSSKNDLIYVPNSHDEIILEDILDADGNILVSANEQWEQLNSFIENDNYLSDRRGEYAERNGARTPWNHQIDVRIEYELPMKKDRSIELTLDIFNFGNMINRNWGNLYFVPNVQNSSYSLIKNTGNNSGTPIFQFFNPSGTPWQIDAINSRWLGQVGLIFNF